MFYKLAYDKLKFSCLHHSKLSNLLFLSMEEVLRFKLLAVVSKTTISALGADSGMCVNELRSPKTARKIAMNGEPWWNYYTHLPSHPPPSLSLPHQTKSLPQVIYLPVRYLLIPGKVLRKVSRCQRETLEWEVFSFVAIVFRSQWSSFSLKEKENNH